MFDSPEDYYAVCDTDDFDVEASDVIVVRYAGPKGYPGMPEVSNVTLPAKLLKQGVTDMVRILRRAHERHGIRDGRPSCCARGGPRRALALVVRAT